MRYGKVVTGRFIDRPNRFIAHVDVQGVTETVHVKNTGRCKELLVPGCTVYLAAADNPARKTKYDLIAVEKERAGKPPLRINMDSQAANDIAEEWLRSGNLFSENAALRREVTFGDSRFDFYVEDGEERAFLEVKGVTLEDNGVVRFPDAPTERGIKHLHSLAACLKDGYGAYVLFVVQMAEVREMRPNDVTHKAFGDALRQAYAAGVKVIAINCHVEPDEVIPGDFVPVVLE